MIKHFFSSLIRISDLAEESYSVTPWDRDDPEEYRLRLRDLLSLVATNTTASVELVRRLTGHQGFSFLIAEESDDAFAVIRTRFGL